MYISLRSIVYDTLTAKKLHEEYPARSLHVKVQKLDDLPDFMLRKLGAAVQFAVKRRVADAADLANGFHIDARFQHLGSQEVPVHWVFSFHCMSNVYDTIYSTDFWKCQGVKYR